MRLVRRSQVGESEGEPLHRVRVPERLLVPTLVDREQMGDARSAQLGVELLVLRAEAPV